MLWRVGNMMGKIKRTLQENRIFITIFLLIFCFIVMMGNTAFNMRKIENALTLLDTKVSMVFYRLDRTYREIGASILRDIELMKTQSNFSKAAVEVLTAQAQALEDINKRIDAVVEGLKFLESSVDRKVQDNKIADEIRRLQQNKVEMNIVQQVVFIVNETQGSLGSGTTIKYNNKYYIITAAHVVGYSDKNKIILKENGNTIGELKVVKILKDKDLALMETKDPDLIPRFYAEIGTMELPKTAKVYICGNPTGIEDVFSEGRIINYSKHVMYIQDHCYFGSSGGGVFSLDGKLIGVVSFMGISDPNPPGIVTHRAPQYIVDGIIRLRAIQEFLADVK